MVERHLLLGEHVDVNNACPALLYGLSVQSPDVATT